MQYKVVLLRRVQHVCVISHIQTHQRELIWMVARVGMSVWSVRSCRGEVVSVCVCVCVCVLKIHAVMHIKVCALSLITHVFFYHSMIGVIYLLPPLFERDFLDAFELWRFLFRLDFSSWSNSRTRFRALSFSTWHGESCGSVDNSQWLVDAGERTEFILGWKFVE